MLYVDIITHNTYVNLSTHDWDKVIPFDKYHPEGLNPVFKVEIAECLLLETRGNVLKRAKPRSRFFWWKFSILGITNHSFVESLSCFVRLSVCLFSLFVYFIHSELFVFLSACIVFCFWLFSSVLLNTNIYLHLLICRFQIFLYFIRCSYFIMYIFLSVFVYLRSRLVFLSLFFFAHVFRVSLTSQNKNRLDEC